MNNTHRWRGTAVVNIRYSHYCPCFILSKQTLEVIAELNIPELEGSEELGVSPFRAEEAAWIVYGDASSAGYGIG